MAQQPYRGPERRHAERTPLLGSVGDALFKLLRFLGRHIQGMYAILGLFLSVGFGLALLAIWGFAALAEEVMEGETQRFDDAVLLWLNEHATPRLDVAALEVTALGGGLVVWMVVLVASAFLWLTRHRLSVLLLLVATLGAGLLNSALKIAFDRPRPQLFEWRTPHVGLASFPSGHAMTSMVVYGTLAYLVTRLEPTPLMRRLTWAFVAIVIFLIGLSRLYLGVHYPSDVIAGFVMGFVWATFCASGIEVIRYFRDRKPEVERVEKDLDRKGGLAAESSAR